MRRRPWRDPSPPPLRLTRFDRREWPDGVDLQVAVRQWQVARREWSGQHPGSQLGTVVEQLRFEVATKRDLVKFDSTEGT